MSLQGCRVWVVLYEHASDYYGIVQGGAKKYGLIRDVREIHVSCMLPRMWRSAQLAGVSSHILCGTNCWIQVTRAGSNYVYLLGHMSVLGSAFKGHRTHTWVATEILQMLNTFKSKLRIVPPTFQALKQDDQEFQADLGYTIKSFKTYLK